MSHIGTAQAGKGKQRSRVPQGAQNDSLLPGEAHHQMAKRYELTDAQWARIEALLPGKAGDRGRTAIDNRLFDITSTLKDFEVGPDRLTQILSVKELTIGSPALL